MTAPLPLPAATLGEAESDTGPAPKQAPNRTRLPAPSPFETLCTAFVTVRSVKFCALTAHTTVTEKYDGGAALTA